MVPSPSTSFSLSLLFATLAINCLCWLPPFVYQLHFQFEICFLHLFAPNPSVPFSVSFVLICAQFFLLLPIRFTTLSFSPSQPFDRINIASAEPSRPIGNCTCKYLVRAIALLPPSSLLAFAVLNSQFSANPRINLFRIPCERPL